MRWAREHSVGVGWGKDGKGEECEWVVKDLSLRAWRRAALSCLLGGWEGMLDVDLCGLDSVLRGGVVGVSLRLMSMLSRLMRRLRLGGVVVVVVSAFMAESIDLEVGLIGWWK